MKSSNYKTKGIKKKYLNTWYVWLIHYTPDLITETVGGFKDKVIKLFKTNAHKQTLYGRRQKLSEPKAQKQFEENIIKSIRNIFVLKKENREIKDIIIRDIRTLFEQEDVYYKPKKASSFWNNNYIEYESDNDRNKKLSLQKYLESDTWKILLTIAINLVSSKEAEEERALIM